MIFHSFFGFNLYLADITFGTNNEFGFDYLRDNMSPNLQDLVQRKHHYTIVDEVDSVLIDDARTPLIISGPAEKSTQLYYQVNEIVPKLKAEADYKIDEKARSATLTEEGVAHAEQMLGVENLYDPSNIELLHHTNQALKAHTLFKRDVDYIVKEGEVIIVDEFTGRLMPGRRIPARRLPAADVPEEGPLRGQPLAMPRLARAAMNNLVRVAEAGPGSPAETCAATGPTPATAVAERD